MAHIHIKHAHALKREEARVRVDKIAQELKKKLSAEGTWEGNSLHFRRSGASGCIDIDDECVECTIELGMLLSPMKGTIEAYLVETMNKMFGGKDQSKST